MAEWKLLSNLFHSGIWNDISGDTYTRNTATITRGRADALQEAPPATVALTLDNRGGEYNPRNPLSPLYGVAGLNTRGRLTFGTPHVASAVTDAVDSTSHVAPSVDSPTDDALLICAWANPDPSNSYTLPGGMSTGPTTSDSLTTMAAAHEAISSAGATGTRTATVGTSEDYTAASVLLHGDSPSVALTGGFSVVLGSIGATAGNWWVVVSYMAWGLQDTHGAGREDDFPAPDYPSDTDGGGWILLADSGVADWADAQAEYARMKVWAKRVKTTGTHTLWIDNPGDELDSVQSVFYEIADVTDWQFRHTGEAGSWTPRRDVDEFDRWTDMTIAGVTRRLGRGADPLDDSIKRFAQLRDPVGYWPLSDTDDDGKGIARAVIGSNMKADLFNSPSDLYYPQWGQGSLAPWLPASLRTPQINSAARPADPRIRGPVQTDAGGFSADLMIRFLPPETEGNINQALICRWESDPDLPLSASYFLIIAPQTGNVVVEGFGASLPQSYPPIFDGRVHHVRVDFTEGAGDLTDVDVYVDGSQILSSSIDIGAATTPAIVAHNYFFSSQTDETGNFDLGPITLWNAADAPNVADSLAAYFGHAGEHAGRRFLRLCAEEDIPAAVVGDPDDTQLIGPQHPDPLLGLLREVELADDGLIYEPRQFAGLTMRTGRSRYNQPAVLELDYTAAQVAPPLEPVVDDLEIRNDWTVSRRDGGSARAVQRTGPNNVNKPEDDPQGVGRYTTSLDVNTVSDVQLPSHAGWHLHVSTVDDIRYPQVTVDLDASPDLVAAASAVDIGDRITVANLPTDLSYDVASLVVLGYTETIGPFRRVITFNCAPASPYQVAEIGHDDYGVVAPGGTALDEDLDTTETGVDVTDNYGYLWVDEAVPFDIIIGGERMTVTAVGAASGNDQTLTVTRSVNGVVKAHSSGDRVDLLHKSYIGL